MRVEELDTLFIAGGTDTIVEPAEAESADIDGGGSGTEGNDEAEEIFDVPARRHGEVFGIHAVPRNCDLGNIVEEILNENL